jgi:polyisoprenoid-binding protein YceI
MKTTFLAALALMSTSAMAQKWMSRDAQIRFFGSTPVENIEAISNQGSAVLDAANGNMACQVFMTSFTFEKALMQEHFNENYVESEKFPKSTFKGNLEGFKPEMLTADGKYNVTAKGTLTLHGVDQPVSTPATLETKGGVSTFSCKFTAKPEDYNIPIPAPVRDKIAERMDVSVKAVLKKQ